MHGHLGNVLKFVLCIFYNNIETWEITVDIYCLSNLNHMQQSFRKLSLIQPTNIRIWNIINSVENFRNISYFLNSHFCMFALMFCVHFRATEIIMTQQPDVSHWEVQHTEPTHNHRVDLKGISFFYLAFTNCRTDKHGAVVVVIIVLPTECKQWVTEYMSNIITTRKP